MREKRDDCEHQWQENPYCQPALRNSYRCPRCGATWDDDWSAECDDDCPKCGMRHITPIESIEIAPCACRHLGD